MPCEQHSASVSTVQQFRFVAAETMADVFITASVVISDSIFSLRSVFSPKKKNNLVYVLCSLWSIFIKVIKSSQSLQVLEKSPSE